jgi:hypothetical protein
MIMQGAGSNVAEVQQTVREAQDAARAGEAGQATATGNGPIIFTSDGGRPVSIKIENGNVVLRQEGNTQVIPWRDVVPKGAVQIAWAVPATLSILLIWWPLTRAVAGWLRRKQVASHDAGALQAQLADRFAQLERNIDTVAIEVERLSEGQRFTNRLLAQRQGGPAPGPTAGRRTATCPASSSSTTNRTSGAWWGHCWAPKATTCAMPPTD